MLSERKDSGKPSSSFLPFPAVRGFRPFTGLPGCRLEPLRPQVTKTRHGSDRKRAGCHTHHTLNIVGQAGPSGQVGRFRNVGDDQAPPSCLQPPHLLFQASPCRHPLLQAGPVRPQTPVSKSMARSGAGSMHKDPIASCSGRNKASSKTARVVSEGLPG